MTTTKHTIIYFSVLSGKWISVSILYQTCISIKMSDPQAFMIGMLIEIFKTIKEKNTNEFRYLSLCVKKKSAKSFVKGEQ